jgi:redox-sensitive bicupin YhaK (pirin superfamily)
MATPGDSGTPLGRSVARVVESISTEEGGGFPVRRPFPTAELGFFDPFLLLDEMGPTVSAPGEAKGAPDHPHRGFETVTYLLSGEMQHRDSAGNAGTLRPGDVQWMTAGAGVIHSEMPTPAFQERGGLMHGFQLWVNLPGRDKLIPPRYQDTPSENIPVVTSPDQLVTVKVIAGEALGARAVIVTHTPISYLHVTIRPGGVLTQPLAATFNVFAYVVHGAPLIGADARPVAGGQLAILDARGDVVSLAVPADAAGPAEVLLIGGEPLQEPVARYGTFVMNTRAEIIQAVEDFQAGRFGSIPGGG